MPSHLGLLLRSSDPPATGPELAERVALVCAQLAPIRSRTALLDSYERESLNRMGGGPDAPNSDSQVLDLAYALRWFELGSAPPSRESDPPAGRAILSAPSRRS